MVADNTTLNFGFWNCAISPPGQSAAVDEEMISAAFFLIEKMFFDHNLAFVVICEINEESFALLSILLKENGFESILANDKSPTGSRMDLACIYIKERVLVSKGETHFGSVGTSSIKISQEFFVLTPLSDSPLSIFASHWPSRLQHVADDFRNQCSIGLKFRLVNLQNEKKQFVLMGDYNDDPYSHTLFKNLMATNDRALVISNSSSWLYNPFWRTLFARSYFNRDSDTHDFGTCYNQSNNRNQWSTFDQIIFSGDFLKEGDWFINEEKCFVISDESFVRLIMDKENKFDHLPVIGSISYC